nr:short transient receptor potential channel 4-associated protein-like [Pocillopora verrucosa]
MAKRNRNLVSSIMASQVSGKCIRTNMLPKDFIEDVDRRLNFKEIPVILAKLERHSSLQRFNFSKCMRYIEELSHFFTETMSVSEMFYSENELPVYTKERARIGQVLNLFGGVEIVVQILFYPVTYGFKLCKLKPSRLQQTELYLGCLDFIHNICLVVDGVAVNLAKRNELISHLFTLLEQKKTFSRALVVLEDLFGSRKEIIDLDRIVNMRKLINILDQKQLGNFCRVLSFTLSDLESVEERSTLLAQDEVDRKGMSQKDVADNNQATLIGLKEFLPRIVRLACQPMVERSSHFLDMVDFQTFLQDVFMSEGLDLESDEHESLGHRTLRSSFSHIQGHIHEVTVFLNTETLTIKTLEEKILKERFGMVAPDVEIDDGKGSILISSEEGETDENLPKTLREFHVGNSARLKADDFLQSYQLILNVVHRDNLEDDVEFEVEGDLPAPKPDSPEPGPSTASEDRQNQPADGDKEEVMVVDEPAPSRKRKADESELEAREQQDSKSSKRARLSHAPADENDDDIIVL